MRVVQLILLFLSICLSAELQFEGPLPPHLDTISLNKEYRRIHALINPAQPVDSSPVIIRFYSRSDAKILGVRLPEWGGGGAIGKDTIIIPVDKNYAFFNTDFQRIAAHELVHIVLVRSYGILRVPRWFHEGLSMALSGEISFDESVILSRAILTSSLLHLDSIENLNRFDHWKAQLSYCQSHFAVSFLIDTYGYDLLPELLSATKRRRNFEAASLEVFGLSTREFEKLLQIEIQKRYKYLFLISDYSLFWVGGALLLIAGFIVTRIRNRSKSKQMELQEEIDRLQEIEDMENGNREEE